MTNLSTTRLKKALALREALTRDVDEMTTADARTELEAESDDPKAAIATTRAKVMEVVSRARKERLASAQGRLRGATVQLNVGVRSVEAIRRALASLATRPTSMAGNRIAMAHRNGKIQSDSDAQSLWQDLVELGAVSDDDLVD